MVEHQIYTEDIDTIIEIEQSQDLEKRKAIAERIKKQSQELADPQDAVEKDIDRRTMGVIPLDQDLLTAEEIIGDDDDLTGS